MIIANRGKPMVRLVKADGPAPKRAWGVWEGMFADAQIHRAFSLESAPRQLLKRAAPLLGFLLREA